MQLKFVNFLIPGSKYKVQTIIFKVSGAQYISATNNAAGRQHLQYWLNNHEQHHGGLKALHRKDGKEYRFRRK
jgi:hypothetical protein